MFRLGADLQVYLHRDPIDFRAGINRLAVLVQETMALDPFAPAVFAFCNRRRDRMKLLFFDRSGFVLVLKRLTEDKFRCRHCDRTGINTSIVIAPMPAQPLPGSIATTSTLAFALVHKYADGTPLYRLVQAFGRAGVPVREALWGTG